MKVRRTGVAWSSVYEQPVAFRHGFGVAFAEEEEAELFFEDRSADVITDDVFARLMTFPNVLVTAHQAFLTHEALDAIATITLQNLSFCSSTQRRRCS